MECVLQKQGPVLFVGKLHIVIQFVLDLLCVCHMVLHVSGKHAVNHYLADPAKVLRLKFVRPVVRWIAHHQLEGSRDVVGLKHGAVVVSNSDWVLHLREICVVHAWMLVVVTHSGGQHAEILQLVQFQLTRQSPCLQEHVYVLTQISAMRFVMICDVLVASLNRGQERTDLVDVDVRSTDTILGNGQVQVDCLKLSSARVIPQLEDVEVKSIAFRKFLLCLLV